MNTRTQPTSGDQRVAAAIHWLVDHVDARPGLDDVASAAGLTPSHFQRLFRQDVGISPKRFLQYLLGREASKRLAAGESVLDATYGASLSSSGRLHDLTVTLHAMTPGELRDGGRGLTLHWGCHDSPFGPVGIAMTERGICSLVFIGPRPDASAFRDSLEVAWPGARLLQDHARTAQPLAQFLGAGGYGPLSLHVRGSNFQLQVWQALLAIPSGATTTYQALADAADRPGAARAVGTAVGANPVAMVIPCHRVIRTSGALGGYRWGLNRKRLLLAAEGSLAPARSRSASQS